MHTKGFPICNISERILLFIITVLMVNEGIGCSLENLMMLLRSQNHHEKDLDIFQTLCANISNYMPNIEQTYAIHLATYVQTCLAWIFILIG